MSMPTRDGTAEPVSRYQILRRERGQGNIHFPCSAHHEQGWQPYQDDPYSCYVYRLCVTIHNKEQENQKKQKQKKQTKKGNHIIRVRQEKHLQQATQERQKGHRMRQTAKEKKNRRKEEQKSNEIKLLGAQTQKASRLADRPKIKEEQDPHRTHLFRNIPQKVKTNKNKTAKKPNDTKSHTLLSFIKSHIIN